MSFLAPIGIVGIFVPSTLAKIAGAVIAVLPIIAYFRVGVSYEGTLLVIRNRTRTVRILAQDVVRVDARVMDHWPNFPKALVVRYRKRQRLRSAQVDATGTWNVDERERILQLFQTFGVSTSGMTYRPSTGPTAPI